MIAVLPYHLGYRPTDSLVLVCLDGPRVALVGRVDLPPPDVPPSRVLDELLPHVLAERPDRVLLIGYADEAVAAVADRVSAAVRDALAREQVAVLDRLLVRSGRWWSLDCAGSCCPAEGTPVPADEDVPAVADYVLLGRRPATSRAALDERLAPLDRGPDASSRAEQLRTDVTGAIDRGGPTLDTARTEALRLWGRALDITQEPPDGDWARLAASLLDVHLRDLVIAWICPGTLELDAVDPALAGRARSALPALAADPDAAVSDQDSLVDRLAALCRRSPVELSPGPLCVLASFTWWRGDGALTRVALERTLEVDPGYRLAGLLLRMVDLAIRPRRAA